MSSPIFSQYDLRANPDRIPIQGTNCRHSVVRERLGTIYELSENLRMVPLTRLILRSPISKLLIEEHGCTGEHAAYV